jgi:beta-glucosidase
VGYRGFEIKNTPPLFPFGFGLSYTNFEYSNLKVSDISQDGTSTVSFDIKNVGTVYGREVVQIYVKDDEASLPRPLKELKGFIKVDLQPGETKSITHKLDREAWGFYEERGAHWVAESGSFKICVAASSTDIRLSGDATLKETFTWVGL